MAPGLRDRLPLQTTIGRKPFAVGVRRNGAAVVIASRDHDTEERGRYNQLRLRRTAYAERRSAPLRDAVFYSVFGGRHVGDSPRRIHEELVRRGAPLEHRWVVHDGQAVVPDGAEALRSGGREHFEALATSRYLVVNDRLPRWFEPREDQVVLQTWHGTPVKQIGRDAALMRAGAHRFEQRWTGEAAGWTYFVSPSRFATPLLRDALGIQGEVLETGLPRTDVLTGPDREARARDVRARLGLSADQRVVLYAPTFRDQLLDRKGRYALDLRLDPDALREAVGPGGVVLVRRHPDVRDAVPSTPDGFLRDVSAYPDAVELLLAADVLISDYSALMVDFANTGRPILVYAYDLELYRDRVRGLYVDVETDVPGPVLRDSAEVAEALRDLEAVHAAHAERYAAFRERLCEFDDGGATARVVDRVFA
jgi:CDP-glycerol glycerophosphotransferase